MAGGKGGKGKQLMKELKKEVKKEIHKKEYSKKGDFKGFKKPKPRKSVYNSAVAQAGGAKVFNLDEFKYKSTNSTVWLMDAGELKTIPAGVAQTTGQVLVDVTASALFAASKSSLALAIKNNFEKFDMALKLTICGQGASESKGEWLIALDKDFRNDYNSANPAERNGKLLRLRKNQGYKMNAPKDVPVEFDCCCRGKYTQTGLDLSNPRPLEMLRGERLWIVNKFGFTPESAVIINYELYYRGHIRMATVSDSKEGDMAVISADAFGSGNAGVLSGAEIVADQLECTILTAGSVSYIQPGAEVNALIAAGTHYLSVIAVAKGVSATDQKAGPLTTGHCSVYGPGPAAAHVLSVATSGNTENAGSKTFTWYQNVSLDAGTYVDGDGGPGSYFTLDVHASESTWGVLSSTQVWVTLVLAAVSAKKQTLFQQVRALVKQAEEDNEEKKDESPVVVDDAVIMPLKMPKGVVARVNQQDPAVGMWGAGLPGRGLFSSSK
jgi:hypothetical protein